MREYVKVIFEDEYLLKKIKSLTKVKGIESDLRFLFEQAFFKLNSAVPETEVINRTDLKLPLNPPCLIEIKQYNAILTTAEAQKEIRKDLLSLAGADSSWKRIFMYFGLYGKKQAPVFSGAFIEADRRNEIEEEIKKIQELANSSGVSLTSLNSQDKLLPDRILYAAWFTLE